MKGIGGLSNLMSGTWGGQWKNLSRMVCNLGYWGSSGSCSAGSYHFSSLGFSWSGSGGQVYVFARCTSSEASLMASDSLRKLRSSIHRVVWSRRQPLASVGAVLSLLDGPAGCDPAFCMVWFRFRLLRRYLALWPTEVGRVYPLLEMASEGSAGHGPIHLLSAFAAEIGFWWDPVALGWSRPGLPLLSNLAGLVQHFKAAILDGWRNKVAADLCGREGFRGGPLLDVHGSFQLLDSSHVRERDKAFVEECDGRWCLERFSAGQGSGISLFHVGFVVLRMVMVTFLGMYLSSS